MKKMEFSKKLLIADYAILALMVVAFFVFNLNGHDTGNCSIVVSAWIAQVAISTGGLLLEGQSRKPCEASPAPFGRTAKGHAGKSRSERDH